MTAQGDDHTVHVVVGLDADGRMYLLDLWRRQAASDMWVEAFCDLVRAWRPIGWAEEGQIRGGVGPFLDRRMRVRSAFVARKQFATRGDKSVRAQSIRGRMALQGPGASADLVSTRRFGFNSGSTACSFAFSRQRCALLKLTMQGLASFGSPIRSGAQVPP